MGQLPKEDGMGVGLRDDPPQGSCRPKLPKGASLETKRWDPSISARVGEAALAAGSASSQEAKLEGSQVAPGTSWYGAATWQLWWMLLRTMKWMMTPSTWRMSS